MKSFLQYLGIVCAGLLLLNMTPAAKEAFTSKEGKFSIAFGQYPSISNQPIATEAGNITLHMYMYEESRSKAFMVAYCDYPDELINQADATTLLKGAQEGVVKKFEATVTTESVTTFQGYSCIDFTASGSQYRTAYKLVLAGNRLYQVGILQDSPLEPREITRFIGSFKITK